MKVDKDGRNVPSRRTDLGRQGEEMDRGEGPDGSCPFLARNESDLSEAGTLEQDCEPNFFRLGQSSRAWLHALLRLQHNFVLSGVCEIVSWGEKRGTWVHG